jgi:hypothetical protein
MKLWSFLNWLFLDFKGVPGYGILNLEKYYSPSPFFLSFFLWHMNLSMADLRNYWTEFHETWWSYRYMFLVDPKVSRKERKKERRRRIIIIIRNGAKTISLPTMFGRLNNNQMSCLFYI